MLLVRGDQLDDQREGRGRLFASGCLSLLPRTGAAQQLLRSWLAGDNGWRPAFASLHIVAPLLRSNCNSVTCIECAFHRNCATSVALLQILNFIKLVAFSISGDKRQAFLIFRSKCGWIGKHWIGIYRSEWASGSVFQCWQSSTSIGSTTTTAAAAH